MRPATLLREAAQRGDWHAESCPRCDPPAVETRRAGCLEGRRLDMAHLEAWRSFVDSLSGRPV